MTRTIGIVGTGLIGGSIGLRARAHGDRVLGFDSDGAAAAQALSLGAIDEAVGRDELYERSEIIVVAAPPRATVEELEAAARRKTQASLIVDVASVKAPIAQAAKGLRNFVATHPLAGAEQSGPSAARADLFEDRSWIYVPPSDDKLAQRVKAFIHSMGARPIAMDAQEHDRVIALTSHLPQVFATLFAGRARERALDADLESISGPVGRELLRLGRSNPELWSEILAYNAVAVGSELRALADELNAFAQALEGGAALAIRDAFLRAQAR